MDVCALGNLMVYAAALSARLDSSSEEIRFAVSMYHSIICWANKHLVISDLEGRTDFVEAFYIFKESARQFGQGLLDYRVALQEHHLYAATDPADRVNLRWFRADVLTAFDDTFGPELRDDQRVAGRPGVTTLFWAKSFKITKSEGKLFFRTFCQQCSDSLCISTRSRSSYQDLRRCHAASIFGNRLSLRSR